MNNPTPSDETAFPLPPGSTIGVLGGGQLGRMLAMAAARLGFHVHVYCPRDNAPAFEVAARHTVAEFDDADALQRFADDCDVVTFEFENIPLAAADKIAATTPLYPPRKALEMTQDRAVEKRFLDEIGVNIAPWAEVDGPDDLAKALAKTGAPALLKTRRLGYDGKGQTPVRADTDPDAAFAQINDAPAILEKKISFEREISVLLARSGNEGSWCYDLPENVHQDGILNSSSVPADLPAPLADMAREVATEIAVSLDYRGVMAVEFFVTDGRDAPTLIVNEIAPRVHNSGHWTLDACFTDQFENHIRAVAGWPLGAMERHSDAVMTNLLGDMVRNWPTIAAEPGVRLHLYGKEDIQPGRKLGHMTRLSDKT